MFAPTVNEYKVGLATHPTLANTKAVHQWELKAQENLTRHEKTGLLPEGMFDFD